MQTYELQIEGMTCEHCALTIEKHLIIIGGGSAAFVATIEAKEHGVKVTMINDGLPIGGTCVNVGCVPSKNLIRAAQTLYKTNNNPFGGITSSARLTDFKTLIEEKTKLVLDLREQKYINIIKDMENFEFIEGQASLVSPTAVKVNGRIIEGSHMLIATGARPMIADIDGLSEVDYLTNEEAFALESLPASMIILGGSYIALEMAQMFARFGSKVTVLQRSERILSHESPDITDMLSGYLQDEGIEIITGNVIQNVHQKNGGVIVKTVVGDETLEIEAEKIVVATGRVANTQNMNLESLGLALHVNGAVKVNDFGQTNISTIYAAGDVTGEHMFVYTAAYEAKTAVANMFASSQQKLDFSVLPWVIFTDPQVAGVGLDEKQAKEKGIDFEVATLPLSYVPRAIAAKDTRGMIKLLRNTADDTLIGARIVAAEGSELLMEISVAMKYGIKVSDLKEMLHPYLTLGEGIKLAAVTFDKNVKELSCCAT
ncbi:mercury(II) reductase [Sulfurimonas sp. SWIR-19]|uniref:mercury(II) reductase n=1 Tax=Sulfurimonas sp. SWIR-19 TaxID=2878390 RepID=UPI001CF1C491|nr:mercury(II) reductase [Sulfurimonas sp. SWIR-19]UCN00221.1 mercury(II) reductase [Sulfurimonas sp. SWIR-19]